MAPTLAPAKTPRKAAPSTAPSTKTPSLPANEKLPAAKWTDNGRRLIDLLITAVEENEFIKRAIWPAPDDTTVGIKKAVAYRFLANVVFKDLPPFKDFMQYKEALPYYGKAAGNQLTLIEKAYHRAKVIMGVTGGGLDTEEEISPGTPMMDKWNEAKKECPEFYRLKELLGERTNVSNHAINNSSQSIDLTSILPGSSRRAARSGSEEEADMDPEAAAEEDEDAEGDAEDDDDVMETIEHGVPKIAVEKASPRKNKGKQKESRDPSPAGSTSSTTTSRKRGSSEFDHLLAVVEQGESRKRRRDAAIEETKRLEARGKTEIRRLELEMAERAEIRKHEYAMEQLRVYRTEAATKEQDIPLPLEAGMKKMALNPSTQLEYGHEAITGVSTEPLEDAWKDVSAIDYQKWMAVPEK